MSENRFTTATFNGVDREVTTDPLYQYDHGQELIIEGLELPEYFEVHFSNDQYGSALTQMGNNNVVTIPDTCLQGSDAIYAWIYLHDTENDGETEYQIFIPIINRAEIGDPAPTPQQATIIEQAISALNEAVVDCENAVAEYPEIRDNYWWVYNPETNEKENSGVKAQGEDAVVPSFSVRSTGTTSPGNPAQVSLDLTNTGYKFDFSIPRGANGANGSDGVTPTLQAGKVTTLPAGSSATVNVVDLGKDRYAIEFGIPQGADGTTAIDDSTTASNKTWSSEKISQEIAAVAAQIPTDIENTVFPTA